MGDGWYKLTISLGPNRTEIVKSRDGEIFETHTWNERFNGVQLTSILHHLTGGYVDDCSVFVRSDEPKDEITLILEAEDKIALLKSDDGS